MVQKAPLRHPRWDPPRDLQPAAGQGAATQTSRLPGWAPVSCWPGPRGHGTCARLRHQPMGPVGPSSPSEAGPKGACSRHPRLPATATDCPWGGSGQLPATRPWTHRLCRGGRDLGAPAQRSAGRLPPARGEPQQPLRLRPPSCACQVTPQTWAWENLLRERHRPNRTRSSFIQGSHQTASRHGRQGEPLYSTDLLPPLTEVFKS